MKTLTIVQIGSPSRTVSQEDLDLFKKQWEESSLVVTPHKIKIINFRIESHNKLIIGCENSGYPISNDDLDSARLEIKNLLESNESNVEYITTLPLDFSVITV